MQQKENAPTASTGRWKKESLFRDDPGIRDFSISTFSKLVSVSDIFAQQISYDTNATLGNSDFTSYLIVRLRWIIQSTKSAFVSVQSPPRAGDLPHE
ncbi:hypothetical protein [Roseibium sp. Sym1]|uniref:hypothetical protein n=1 Tax=Roseibium sp. Sym1 TaxID=3016006 RepID=UPI0022B33782|nr:hypothetical protein [Roseibium sp. Sym1]